VAGVVACSSDTPSQAAPDGGAEPADPADGGSVPDVDTRKGEGEPCESNDECSSGICELTCSTVAHALPEPGADPLAGCTLDPGAPVVEVDAGAEEDPIGGAKNFTLAQALAGFPAGSGKLTAIIRTELGPIKCELAETAAPLTVANFVGLARGTRPSMDASGQWKATRFYDGLTWHRVIPGFVIQGGDPSGDGTGGPGYNLVTENHVDEPFGTLAAAAGIRPSGSQFYVVVGQGPKPDYNVFGVCSTKTAVAISRLERDEMDRPKTPVHMVGIDIARCP
jgi:peptidyl-prolyl cis-trans isomerase A (cyclophilin A)